MENTSKKSALSLEEEIIFKGKWFGGFTIDDDGVDSGNFKMYVIQLKKVNEFIGKIKDKHGISYVIGTLTDNKIKFVKKYSQNAISNGAIEQPLRYSGKKIEEGKQNN